MGASAERARPLSRRAENKARTRAAILKAATAKFGRRGIAGATMDEIAEEAGVSRATLFNYFPSKGDIVAALVARMDEDFVALVLRCADEPLPVPERIRRVFAESARRLEGRRDVTRPLVGISEQSWGEGAGMARVERLVRAFERLVDDGGTAYDPRLAAEMLVSIYIGLVHNFRMIDDYPLARRLEAAAGMVARMLTADVRGSATMRSAAAAAVARDVCE